MVVVRSRVSCHRNSQKKEEYELNASPFHEKCRKSMKFVLKY